MRAAPSDSDQFVIYSMKMEQQSERMIPQALVGLQVLPVRSKKGILLWISDGYMIEDKKEADPEQACLQEYTNDSVI